MTAGAGFVTEEMNHMTSTGTNPPAGIGNIDQTTKTKMKMNFNFNKEAIVYCIVQGLGAIIILWLCLHLVGCKTVGTVSENVNIRDSVVYNYRDSVAIHWIDSIRFVGSHTVKDDSTNLVISFGQGGGTYNAKTGEATNVTAVQQTDTHHEQKDSTAFYRNQYRDEVAKTDSLTQQVSDYQYQLQEERKRARSSYDRFCSWWFWVTAVLLVIKIAAWVMEKFPATAPYIIIARKFIPFL